MWQAIHVADLLARQGAKSEILAMVSSGDVDMRPIDGKRSVGVFTKRIQQALLDGEGDLAVHSMKDLPTEGQATLRMIATPDRETVQDCLVSPSGCELDSLARAARVGTGSRRRAAQLLHLRPDLQILPIRGNVQTRLKKMHDGEYDAIVLAAAGLLRLDMDDLPRATLPLESMLPAPGQGALAIEVRADDHHAVTQVGQLNSPVTDAATLAERTLLAELHGGCLAPIAALGTLQDGRLELVARVLSLDGTERLEAKDHTRIDLQRNDYRDIARQLGHAVAQELIGQGARPLIESAR